MEEVRAGIAILKAAGLRREGVRFVSCPTCGRTQIDLIALAQEVEQRLQGLERDITVAVTFDAGKIQDIKIVKNAENPILAKKVFTDLKDQVVLSPPRRRLISGATFSAKGFIDASTTLRRRPA